MFTPERMHQLNVMVFETEVDDVAKSIVRLGILHLVQLDDAEPWIEQLGQFEAGKVSSKIDRLYNRVTNLMKDLGIRELPLEEGDTKLLETSIADFEEMETEIDELEKRVEGLVLRRKELEVHLERMQGILNEVSPLTELGLPPGHAPYTFLEVRYGMVSAESLELIREKTAALAAVVIPLTQRDGKEFVLLIGLKTDRLKLKRILRDAAFEDIEMPAGEEAREEAGLVTGELEERIEKIKEQIDELKEQLSAISEEYAPILTGFNRSLRVAEMLLKVKSYLKKTRKTYIFSGWIPSDRKRDVEGEILRAARGRAIVEIISPEEITGVKGGEMKVPVMLKNPGFFRPFEMLVSSYGLPEYKFVDPTVFVAISFLIMFGMMFGDVGHGLAIVALGAAALRLPIDRIPVGRLVRLRPVAPFLLGAGLASVGFGLLYGEAFGPTGLVPTLWLHPLDEPESLLLAGLVVGGCLLSITFVFATVNRWREGGSPVALYATSGIAGALLFAGAVGVVAGVASSVEPLWRIGVGIGAIGVLLTFLGLFARAGHGASAVAEASVETFDAVLRIGSNTVSFARLAAFGLTHAVITGVVWDGTVNLWDRASIVAGVAAIALFTVGNLGAFALGALVAAVQALRLEYYEMFSRLFASEGRPFEPWRLPDEQERPHDQELSLEETERT